MPHQSRCVSVSIFLTNAHISGFLVKYGTVKQVLGLAEVGRLISHHNGRLSFATKSFDPPPFSAQLSGSLSGNQNSTLLLIGCRHPFEFASRRPFSFYLTAPVFCTRPTSVGP